MENFIFCAVYALGVLLKTSAAFGFIVSELQPQQDLNF